MSSQQNRQLKLLRLFKRDGWLADGGWRAKCAFGCGVILTIETATIDRYPKPGRKGGTYADENTRLACKRCNNRDGMPYNLTKRQRRKWLIDTGNAPPELLEAYKRNPGIID